MSGIFGMLNLNSTDNQRDFVDKIGQNLVFDAANEFLAQWSAGLQAAISVFIQEITPDYKERFLLPGAGRLQRLREAGPSAAVKRTGSWDVAYPLEGFGASLAWSRVSMAYLTLGEFDTHLDTITNQATATVRFELLKALLNNTQDTFTDPIRGDLSIEPLANGDAVVYPPVLGSETEATEDHYLESGYLASAVDDTNNPYKTIRDELVHHFGRESGGYDIISWIHPDQQTVTEDLTDFDPVTDRYVEPGDQTATINPPAPGPGVLLGRTNGVTVKVWDWVPTGYMINRHMQAPAPLKQRRDPLDVNLPMGLVLVQTDEMYPLSNSSYEIRFGFGCGNRLNGVVMELATGGTYSIPSGYS